MALSRLAREFAAEIRNHDWSDAPYRADRAGHQHHDDRPERQTAQLKDDEAVNVKTNVMWEVAQVLGHADPNFDEHEFAEAAGVNPYDSRGRKSRSITAGLRKVEGQYCRPGTWDVAE